MKSPKSSLSDFIMNIHHLISNATDSPLPQGEGLGVRSFTMFAAGVGTLDELKQTKLVQV